MGIWKIALRSIQQRALSSSLTSLSMALGVMLVVIVLVVLGIVRESFTGKGDLGYNLVVGKKGSKLQLVLNSVYYLSQPIENVPYAYFQRFVTAEQQRQDLASQSPEVLAELKDGVYAKQVSFAIPLALGDYYDRFRVIGTTPRMFDNFYYNRPLKLKYEFAEGRNFQHFNKENGFFEAVIGATVARETNLRVGSLFSPSHGEVDGKKHDHNHFHVVGVLKPSGTPVDRGVFVNIEGFYLIPEHIPKLGEKRGEADLGTAPATPTKPDAAKPNLDKPDAAKPDTAKPATGSGDTSSTSSSSTAGKNEKPDPHAGHDHAHDHDHVEETPLPLAQREVTAILVSTKNAIFAMRLPPEINKGNIAQAVPPLEEIEGMMQYFVRPGERFMIGMAMLICLLAGVSILVSIYNSMNDRRHEIAVMRALGAGRGTVLTIVLAEAVLLSLAGGLLGWFGGHLVVWMLGGAITEVTGVNVSLFSFGPTIYPIEFFSTETPRWNPGIPSELLLIPGLISLAIFVGLIPAITAYRTDVGKALSNT